MPVAETFTFEDEEGDSLSLVADLDTMVTVVGAGNFMKDFGSWDDLTDRRLGLSDEDTRNIVDLLVDQVEFANVIVVNKTDLILPYELKQLKQILRQLNANAKILCTTESQVELSEIMGTGLYSLSEAETQPGWLGRHGRTVDHPELACSNISSSAMIQTRFSSFGSTTWVPVNSPIAGNTKHPDEYQKHGSFGSDSRRRPICTAGCR